MLVEARVSVSYTHLDDYDSEFRYDGRPIAALQSLNAGGNVLYVGTMTKVLFPGLRIAYLVVPEPLVSAFVAGRSLIDGSAAKFNQVVLAEFMREGHFTAHTRRMRQIYQARRDLFIAAFERHLGDFATCNAPRAGLHVTAPVSYTHLDVYKRQVIGWVLDEDPVAGIE